MGVHYPEKLKEKAFEIYLTGESGRYIAENASELFGSLLPRGQTVKTSTVNQWIFYGKWTDKRKALQLQIEQNKSTNKNRVNPLEISSIKGSQKVKGEGKIIAKVYRSKLELIQEQADILSIMAQKFKQEIKDTTIRPADYIASIEEHQKLVSQLQQARETQAILDPRVENNPKVLEAKKKLEQAIYEAEKEAGIV